MATSSRGLVSKRKMKTLLDFLPKKQNVNKSSDPANNSVPDSRGAGKEVCAASDPNPNRPLNHDDVLVQQDGFKNDSNPDPGGSAPIPAMEKTLNPVPSTSTLHSSENLRKPLQPDLLSTQEPSTSFAKPHSVPVCDIGNYLKSDSKLDDFTLYNILTNHWQPPADHVFPYSEHVKQGKVEKRYLKLSHLNDPRFKSWLIFSDIKKGLYCKFCPFFTVGNVGGSHKHVQLNKLLKTPLTSFAKLLGKDGDLEVHSNTDYHKQGVLAGQNFISTYLNPSKEVVNHVVSYRMEQIEDNRKRLLPIISTIVFLGRQNIPLRGHRYYGKLDVNVQSVVNEGNFRETLRLRVQCGDKVLEQHLATASSRATYISKEVQNELINLCGKEITDTIISRIKKAKYYSVIFDETTDESHTSQMTLVLRYVHSGVSEEDFFEFLNPRKREDEASKSRKDHPEEANDSELIEEEETDEEKDERRKEEKANEEHFLEPALTGEKLGQKVVSFISEAGLDVKNCVGLGTDGCSVMVSEVHGAVQEIRKKATNAVRSPCLNHGLNLSLSKSSTLQSVRNTTGIIQETVTFFTASSKRNAVLKHFVGQQLPSVCETRWVERHTAFLEFRSCLPDIAIVLDAISNWKELNSSSKTKTLIAAVTNPEFIVTLVSMCDILALTLPFSRILQDPARDLVSATDMLTDTLSSLDDKRSNAEEVFSEIFAEATKIAADFVITLTVPRKTKIQRHRMNHPTNDPEEYYKQVVYIPILDAISQDLKTRFPSETMELYGLNVIMPKNVMKIDSLTDDGCVANLKTLCKRYCSFVNLSPDAMYRLLQAELSLWEKKWERVAELDGEKIPSTVSGALSFADETAFPVLNNLLRIFATLPISVATAERSFHALRRLKTWLRTTMGQDRLNGLALLHVHRDIPVDPNKVLDRFAKAASRRLDLLL